MSSLSVSRRLLPALLCAGPVLSLSSVAQACSSCGCSVGTEWSEPAFARTTGLRLDLRYDFIDQNQLRRQRSPVAADPANPPDDLEEVQLNTLTRFYTLGLDYAPNPDWGFNLQLPYLVRSHTTVPLDDGNTTEISGSHDSGIGDVRLVARYQGLLDTRALGLQLGLKLPTGAFRQNFASGPDADAPLDRGLQLGTGTTDLIVGAYYTRPFAAVWDHFEQLQYKQPLNSREQFRPGGQATATAGLRYLGFARVVPQLQLNFRYEARELGAQADYDNSGSRVLNLSPGASLRLSGALNAYGFVQLPLYQDYTGYQLAPRQTYSAGLSYRF